MIVRLYLLCDIKISFKSHSGVKRLIFCHLQRCKPPIPLGGDSATIRNFGQNDTNRSRNGKSTVEAQEKRSRSAQVLVEACRNFIFYVERIQKRNKSVAPSPRS